MRQSKYEKSYRKQTFLYNGMFKLPVNESKTIQETQLKCIDSLKTLNLLLSAWGGVSHMPTYRLQHG